MLARESTNTQIMNVLLKMDKKIDNLDYRIDNLDQTIDSIGHRIDSIDHRMENIEHRMNSIDQRMNSIDQRMDNIENRMDSIDCRMDETEKNHFDLLGFLQENMVTKTEFQSGISRLDYKLRNYVDRKISDLRGDLVQIGVL